MSEFIWGRRPVLEALRSKSSVEKILLAETGADSPPIREVLKEAKDKAVPVELLDRSQLTEIVGTDRHQGVVAEVGDFSYQRLSELIEARPSRLLLLDGVTDPVNLGSILRSALAFGFHGVLLPRHRSVGVSAVVRKVAAGAAERVGVAQIGSPAETISRLKESDVFVVGLDPDGGEKYHEFDYPDSLCLVLGAEGKGLSRLVKERCDVTVRIPLSEEMASLNVSVAAAIVMAQARLSE